MPKKTTKQNQRKWLPNLSELIDRLSIHQLKEVFIPEHKKKYRKEMKDIVHDIDLLLKDKKCMDGHVVRLIIVMSQINAHIWYNESKARSGQDQDLLLLQLTHGLNGIRNRAGNEILRIIGDGDRQDYKTDCLAAEHSKWDIDIKP